MSVTAATPAPAETVTPFRLTAMDRCDACQAQAYVEVTGPTLSSELLYCAHHFVKYEQKLRAIATSIHDERARLLEDQTRVGISA
ncbi:hypothetical protein [Microbacterium sp. 77mftsu3.1]|uniref:DUF7455 domain-containing protein n=1 Tax=Microbacterium sp. 77mftsu3.1 TaxID=1761802 RepID=UPI000381F139|nr:hypothetical protein [Microbacterium sp. 77mftsu3.1]SDH39261.1 hypothetical protein SAMN04488590_3219 [Microbacterium sp. 77mftsu3.1]